MLVVFTIGVSGLGRLTDEQSGSTNRSMFSYRAKRRRSRGETVEEEWVEEVAFENVPDEYAAIFLLSRPLISNT